MSEEEAHTPLVIVHANFAESPTTNPVIPVPAEAGVVIVATPETSVHKPVPTAGVFAAIAVEVVLHNF